MPWTKGEAGGFTTGTPWLPVPDAHRARAVAVQEHDDDAPLNRLRRFIAWRAGEPALVKGELAAIEAVGDGGEALLVSRRESGRMVTGVFNLTGRPARLAAPQGERLAVPGFEGVVVEGGDTLELPPFSAAFFAED